MSKTESELIHCLQHLGRYTEKWDFNIIEKKTKIAVFNKAGHFHKISARIGSLNIKSCSEYTYMGTLLMPAGTCT